MTTIKYISGLLTTLCFIPLYSVNPHIGLDFTSVDAINCRTTSGTPQNPMGPVGKTQYIVGCYPAIRSFNKLTGQADGILNIDSAAFGDHAVYTVLFGQPVGGASDLWSLYEHFETRFLYSSEVNGGTELIVMLSGSGGTITPLTTWYNYIVDAETLNPIGGGEDGFVDYNQGAYDQNAYYNSSSGFDEDENFIGCSLVVIPITTLAAEDAQVTVFPGLFAGNLNNLQEAFACPAINYDTNPEFGYIICLTFDEAEDFKIGSTIQMHRISNAGTTPTLEPLVTMDATPFASNNLTASHKGNLFGVVGGLQVMTPGPGTGVHVRNHQLYIVTDSQIDSTGNANINGDRFGVIWWQFDLTGDPTGQGLGTETATTVPVLVRSETIYDSAAVDPLNYFMPSIMTNKNNDMMLSLNTAGNNAYINTNYAFRAANENATRPTVQITDTPYACNWNYYVSELPGPNVQRWGDQSSVFTDPDNDTDFWLTQPFAGLPNAWGIRTTQVIVS